MQALSRLKHWKVHFSGKGSKILSQSKTRSGVRKEACLKCDRADFHLSQAPLPKARGKSPHLPYLGDGSAPYFSSDTSSWRKSPQWCSFPIASYLPAPLPFPVTDWWPPQVPPECTPWQEAATLSSLNWFPLCPYLDPDLGGDSHPWPPLSRPTPQRNYGLLGDLLFWINIKRFSAWYQVAAAPSLLGWGLCICVIFILCLFSWQMASFSLLGWHGGERKGDSRGMFCLMKGR